MNKLLWILVAWLPLVYGQEPTNPKLDLNRIYGENEFKPAFFESTTWQEGQDSMLAVETSSEFPEGQDLVRYDVVSGERKVILAAGQLINDADQKPLGIDDYSFGPAGKLLLFTKSEPVWRYNTRGDYWVVDLQTHKKQQLGPKFEPSSLMFAKFSPDGSKVAYVQKHNIYVEDLSSGEITQLTTDGTETLINGTFDWVYEEEFSIQDGFRWSPDGSAIAFWQLDASGIQPFYMINNTDTLYPTLIPLQYPKAGTTNSSCKAGVVHLSTKEITWVKLEGDPRQNYIARMEWTPQGDGITLQYLNRLQNHLQFLLADPNTGTVRQLLEEKDPAWVDVVEKVQWLNKGKNFTWLSERDGWLRVYQYDLQGKAKTLTPFDFDIISVVGINEKQGTLYFIASPDNPGQRYLYKTNLKGTPKAVRLTPVDQPGNHRYDISPDQRWAIHIYSAFTKPPRFELIRLPSHEVVRVLETNEALAKKIASLELGEHEFFKVPIGDVSLDAWMIRPPKFDSSKKYPILFYVYGEPANQTVMDDWSPRNLWHHYLAQQGYIVCSVDNRGTPAPHGRAWRKAAYQQIGTLTSADQAAATKEILKRPYIDSEAVAIWGWSGGGSQTLNAMFRYGDIYKTGMAVAAVSDMRYYDTIYQERYTGLPDKSPEAYSTGSPITYAENLKGNLLMVHGTGDDNVHYQCMEALVNRLIENNKVFTMMAYPNRNHSMRPGKATSLHLYSLMTRYLMEHHKPGPY